MKIRLIFFSFHLLSSQPWHPDEPGFVFKLDPNKNIARQKFNINFQKHGNICDTKLVLGDERRQSSFLLSPPFL